MPGTDRDSSDPPSRTALGRTAAAERERAYRECMGLALSHLARSFPRLGPDDRLDIYADVWTRLLERNRDEGFWPDRIEPYVLKAVTSQALQQRRNQKTRRTEPSDPMSGPIAAQLDEAMEESVEGKLDGENIEALIRSLTPLQAKVAKLRFDWGLAPREIAELLGLRRRRVYKEINRATAKLRTGAAQVRDGSHVGRYDKLLRRYLAGTASDAERGEAGRLIETSSQARMIAAELFRASKDVAAALPAPAIADSATRARLAEGLVAVKQQVADSFVTAKQQTSAAYVRASEVPQQVGQHAAALRPGSSALAISGCIATLGGGTICAVEGVNPGGALYDVIDQPDADEPKPAADTEPDDKAGEPPPPPQLPATPAPEQPAAPAPAEKVPAPEPVPATPPERQEEFVPSPGRSPVPSAPAPGPGSGTREFM